MKKIYVTWNEYQQMIDILGSELKKCDEKFDGIYGIPRGGLPMAVSLSHILNLPLLLYPTKNTLVVDDISDTGKTLASHKNKKIVTLFSTTWTITKPDFWTVFKENKDSWIIFQWEYDDKEQTTLPEFEKEEEDENKNKK